MLNSQQTTVTTVTVECGELEMFARGGVSQQRLTSWSLQRWRVTARWRHAEDERKAMRMGTVRKISGEAKTNHA